MGKEEQKGHPEEQEFAFIKEKIKDKPINKRRLMLRGVSTIVFAVIFGLISCFIFVLLQPAMQAWLYPEADPTISIPKDEEPEEPETPPEPVEPADTQDDAIENQPIYITEMKELEVVDYQALQNKLYAVGKKANKSVVTVTSVTTSLDLFNSPLENQSSGIIIYNNGQELLILTEKKVITDAELIHITFINGDTVPATMKKYDGNTGIAIISVNLASISEETFEKIEVAQLGNSLTVSQGTVVIAIGSPQGSNYSILCGTITSSGNTISTKDSNYTSFTTDITGNQEGNGVLINLDGEIVGLVMQDYANAGGQNTLTALSISELKQIIEYLSNNKDIPYLGLQVNTVTDAIEKEYDIPKGIYISFVHLESPAMAVGLQVADVIIKVNGEEVHSADQYTQKLLSMEPGQTVTLTVLRQNADSYTEFECPPATIGVLP
ncbi:S1C family serine protease [Lachnospiraceae bacterium ZAX-1]